ncbi:AAA family ATPase [Candidatus Uhrbacteria bacterium]|nr:AAA family ATPase [Candidatus Uhrbacteria bacterium]
MESIAVIVESSAKGILGVRSMDPQYVDGTIVAENIVTVGASVGERWESSLVFDEGRGHQRKRTVRLMRRCDATPDAAFVRSLGEDFWVDPDLLWDVQVLLRAGRFVILRGLSGTGKTTLAKRLADAMRMTSIEVDVGMVEEAKQFFGEESAQHGTTAFRRSALTQFLLAAAAAPPQDPRAGATHLVRLDEVNRVHPKIFAAAWNGLFDDDREVTVTTSEGSVSIVMPPHVGGIATMNPNDPRFGGTYALDAATMNRAAVFDVGFPPKEFEVELLQRQVQQRYHQSIARNDAIHIVNAAAALRTASERRTIPLAPSPRNTLDCALCVARGRPVKIAIERILLQVYEDHPDDPESARKQAGEIVRSQDVSLSPRAKRRP